jgi:hypothetical protein
MISDFFSGYCVQRIELQCRGWNQWLIDSQSLFLSRLPKSRHRMMVSIQSSHNRNIFLLGCILEVCSCGHCYPAQVLGALHLYPSKPPPSMHSPVKLTEVDFSLLNETKMGSMGCGAGIYTSVKWILGKSLPGSLHLEHVPTQACEDYSFSNFSAYKIAV